jgi:hypothetical protein
MQHVTGATPVTRKRAASADAVAVPRMMLVTTGGIRCDMQHEPNSSEPAYEMRRIASFV